MDEYIRKKDAIKSVAKHLRDAAEFDYPYAARRISEWKPLAKSYLSDAQTVDVAEVVRCVDCIHKDNGCEDLCNTIEGWYCAGGERRESDG